MSHPGTCSTGKRIYWEEHLAARAVNVARDRGELPPMRHYMCPHCARWHLSSQPDRRPFIPPDAPEAP
jgi:hypothetical protein